MHHPFSKQTPPGLCAGLHCRTHASPAGSGQKEATKIFHYAFQEKHISTYFRYTAHEQTNSSLYANTLFSQNLWAKL